tara:strand:+ start:1603 stop:3297 length:1695 start_codon:yes stop_codon:yes gene_type:complete
MTLEEKYWLAGFIDGIRGNPLFELRHKKENRYAWRWEFSTPNSNELLRFFKERLNAKIVKVSRKSEGKEDSKAVRFTKTSLIGIINEIGPYIRSKREVFKEIAKTGKRSECFGKNHPVEMPTHQFEAKYQEHYAAGMLEASANPYIEFRIDRIRNKTNLQRNLGLSPLFSKFLKHYNIKAIKASMTAKKIKIGGTQDMIKFLKILTPAVRFRNELISFYNLLLELEHLDFTSRAKKIQQYNEAVKSYIFDESLIEEGTDGKIVAQQNKERKKWIEEDNNFITETKLLVHKKTRRQTSTFKKIKSEVRRQLEIIQIQFNALDRMEKNLDEALSDEATCRECKKKKPKSEFTVHKANHHGVCLYCKSCISKKGKIRLQDPKFKEKKHQYYLDNRERQLAYAKEYSKTYVSVKDDYDKYVDKTSIGSGEEFWNSKKEIEDFKITVHRGVALSKNDFFMHLEEEWRLLPLEIKDHYELPHELTAEEIFELRKKGFIDIDHIIPKAQIKRLVQDGHAKGCEVYPHHGLNLRPLPKELNSRRSASSTLFSYYPNYKKRIKRIHRAVFKNL